jgi:hypothetical protein
MDLNELLFQHQRAILRAGAGNPESDPRPRASAHDLVGHYARRIRHLRERMGVASYPEWMLLPPGMV